MTLANPDPDKKYNVTYNAKTNTMVISIDDAVENIFDDEVEAVYYNLQGVRVDNPANGIFVRVAGSKTEKVMK